MNKDFRDFLEKKETMKYHSNPSDVHNIVSISKGVFTRTTIKEKDVVNRATERKLLTYLDNQDITPKMISFEVKPNETVFKHVYVKGKMLSEVKLTPKIVLQVLAVLNKLHKNRVKVEIFNFKKITSYYGDKVDYTKIHHIVNYVDRHRNSLVLCHNDTWPNNVVLTPTRAYLLDFEYSCLNDYLSDIAILMIGLDVDEKMKEFIYKHFKFNKDERIRLNEWMYFHKRIYYLWLQKRFVSTKNDDYKKILYYFE